MSTGAITGIDPNGIDVNRLYKECFQGINTLGGLIQGKLDELTDIQELGDATLYQTEMLNVQFYMGQYNALLEMTSTISKSLTDMMKTLAQRSS